jgi:hypothetical protein
MRLTIPQATEWERIGNQIDTAFILARSNLVNVYRNRRRLRRPHQRRVTASSEWLNLPGLFASEVAQKSDKLVLLFNRSKPARELLIAKFLEPDASQIIEFLHWN